MLTGSPFFENQKINFTELEIEVGTFFLTSVPSQLQKNDSDADKKDKLCSPSCFVNHSLNLYLLFTSTHFHLIFYSFLH